jgi:hypothetical protein
MGSIGRAGIFGPIVMILIDLNKGVLVAVALHMPVIKRKAIKTIIGHMMAN